MQPQQRPNLLWNHGRIWSGSGRSSGNPGNPHMGNSGAGNADGQGFVFEDEVVTKQLPVHYRYPELPAWAVEMRHHILRGAGLTPEGTLSWIGHLFTNSLNLGNQTRILIGRPMSQSKVYRPTAIHYVEKKATSVTFKGAAERNCPAPTSGGGTSLQRLVSRVPSVGSAFVEYSSARSGAGQRCGMASVQKIEKTSAAFLQSDPFVGAFLPPVPVLPACNPEGLRRVSLPLHSLQPRNQDNSKTKVHHREAELGHALWRRKQTSHDRPAANKTSSKRFRLTVGREDPLDAKLPTAALQRVNYEPRAQEPRKVEPRTLDLLRNFDAGGNDATQAAEIIPDLNRPYVDINSTVLSALGADTARGHCVPGPSFS